MEQWAVRCQGLTKLYGKVVGIEGLDLAVPAGSVFGLVGPNGAGKTTTIRLLTGLSSPTSGQAWVAGQPVFLESVSLRQKIGYLQETLAFYGWMSGREFLSYVGELFGMSRRERERRGEELLELVGLQEAAARRISGYSRGMRQRLGIAQALINSPQVLFLDEPCSALDPMGRREVLAVVERLKGRSTVLMSTHILSDVERVCDRVAILNRGHLLLERPLNQLLREYPSSVFSLEVEGDAGPLRDALGGQPWVSGVEAEPVPSGLRIRLHVSDADTAKRQLPRLVADHGVALVHLELARPSLEEVFIRLLEGEKRTG
ncbi:MAG: ABC transporter ATP-binding protein [Chloroflexi bacterium]|nr:ABC transporter ATP-binding protein [Chloroflexota bacterium]